MLLVFLDIFFLSLMTTTQRVIVLNLDVLITQTEVKCHEKKFCCSSALRPEKQMILKD